MPGSSTSEKTIDVFIGSAAGGGCDQRVSDSHSTAQHSESGSIRLAHRSGPHSLARLRGNAEQSTAVRHVPANAQLMGRDVLLRAAIHAATCTESVNRMGVGNVENRTAQTDEPLARVRARERCLCSRRRSVSLGLSLRRDLQRSAGNACSCSCCLRSPRPESRAHISLQRSARTQQCDNSDNGGDGARPWRPAAPPELSLPAARLTRLRERDGKPSAYSRPPTAAPIRSVSVGAG